MSILKKSTTTKLPNVTKNGSIKPPKKSFSAKLGVKDLMTAKERGKLEQELVPNYSSVEYLCKDVKASKGVAWVTSLRDGKESPRSAKKDPEPPTFWSKDIDKWQKKFKSANKLRLEELKKIENDFSLSLRSTKDRTRSTCFSVVDPILFKGNTSLVFFIKEYSTSI